MELWFLIFLSISLCTALIFLLNLTRNNNKSRRLPPGPPALPIVGNLLLFRRSPDLESILRQLHAKYGPIITLRVGSRPSIFISDRHLAHNTLIEHGITFANRPLALPITKLFNGNQRNISSASYGPLWRLLRRNLISEILHPSRLKLYSHARDWVLTVLITKLRSQAESGDGVVSVMESFQFAMFCLLVFMCFGEKLDEKSISDIKTAQRDLLLYFNKLRFLAFVPSISKFVYRKRINIAIGMRQKQKELFLPLISARKLHKQQQSNNDERFVYSYMDSLLDMELLPEEQGKKLNEDEIVSLCSEFLNGGTDTTSTALQWIMANLVKNQDIQDKLLEEIQRVVGSEKKIQEEDLQKMPYLKAVILEGLRRHPPGHFVLPHAVSEDITIAGYLIPKNATINFLVAEMGRDGKVWEEPLEFKPERFLGEEGVDITGSREIKMMPFGVGRRICPGLGLALLHLEFFVANLVREFQWKAVEGEEIDMSEKPEFTVVMKNPLRVRILPR